MTVTQLWTNVVLYVSHVPHLESGQLINIKIESVISPVSKTHPIALTESWKGDSVAKGSVCVCMLVNVCIFSVLIWLCSQMTVPLYNMTLKCAKCGVISSADLSTTATSNAMLVLLIIYQSSTAQPSVLFSFPAYFLPHSSLVPIFSCYILHSPLIRLLEGASEKHPHVSC